MSLINDALKKAQRLRTEESAGDTAGTPEGGPAVAKRRQPKSANATVMIAVGALVLVAISIAITAWWLTRPVSPAEPPAAKPAPAEDVAAAPAPKLELPGVVSTTPSAAAASKPEPSTAAETATASSATDSVAAAATPAATEPVVAPVPPAPQPKPQPDERVRHFIDSLRVAGVNASGTSSKVLMNDHVYRVNQLVDPDLGVRLTKVSSDSLTFTDRNGVTYVKYF